jgi:hypothetical protein
MALGIYVLAVAVRLVFLSEVQDNPLYQFLILNERVQHETAFEISRGTLPPNAYLRTPFFAYFLGTIYKIIGPDALRARFIQIFVVSWTPVLLFVVGCRLFDRAVGVLAGLLAAVYWTNVFFSAELLDISLACVFYLLLLCVLIAVDDGRTCKWFFAGGLMGLGAITRPNILAFAPVLAVMVVMASRREAVRASETTDPRLWLKTGLVRGALLTIGTVLAIAPVTIRNMVVANEKILIACFGGIFLYVANNPTSDGKNAVSPILDITVRHPGLDLNNPWVRSDTSAQAAYLYAAQYLGPHTRWAQVERFHVRLTLDYIRHYPGKFLTDTFKRFCWTFNAYEFPSNKDLNWLRRFSPLLNALSWVHFGLIGPLGVVGLVMAIRRRPRSQPYLYYIAMLLSLALPGVFLVINTRYRLPVVLLLIPAAAYAIVQLVRMFVRPIHWRRLSVYMGALAALMVFSNVNVFGYRPPHHEHALFSYAGACGAMGRDDLMADAIEEIEQALADTSCPHMLPPFAMTCLFSYYHERGNLARAAHYAARVLKRDEPADARMLARIATVFTQAGQGNRARRALEKLIRRTGGQPDPSLAAALLAYGEAFNDRAVLTGAARQLTVLVRQNPAAKHLRESLARARRKLASLPPAPASQAVTTQP